VALKRAQVSVPFTGGVDTQSDEHVLLPDRLSKLENGEFTKRGKVRMRPGHTALGVQAITGTTQTSTDFGATDTLPFGTKRTHATRDDELLLTTSDYLYSYIESIDKWSEKGSYIPFSYSTSEVCRVNANQSYSTCATSGNIRMVAWVDSRASNTVRYTILDASTGATIRSDVSISNATRPTAVPLDEDRIALVYADTSTNDIKGYTVVGSDPYTTAARSYVTDLDSSRIYAVTTDGSSLYFLYHSTNAVVAAGVSAASVNFTASSTAWKVNVSADTPTCLDISLDTTTLQFVWYDGANVDIGKYATNSGTGTTFSAGAVANVVKVASSPYDTSIAGNEGYAYEVSAASTDLHTVTINGVDGATATLQHVHLVSSGFRLGEWRRGYILGHDSRTGLQNSYYIIGDDYVTYGQIHFQTADDRQSTAHLARVWDNEIALGFKRQLDAEGTNAVFTYTGISRVVFDWDAKPAYADVGGTCYLTGGLLHAYDGQFVTEANFLMWPDMKAADITYSNGTGSLTNSATYNYRVYYVATRANGEKIRSNAVAISKAAGGTDDTATLDIPTLTFTRWTSVFGAAVGFTPTNLSIEVYRTIGDDTTGIYYRVSGHDPGTTTGPNRFVYNDVTAASVSFQDDRGDLDLVAHEVDYLTRGELEHIPTPAPSKLVAIGSRLFAAGGGIPEHQVRYSKLRFPGEPFEFSDLLTIDDLPAHDGPVTALSRVNETPVVFKQRGITAIAGQGVDNTGTSGAYASQPITADLGCEGVSVVYPEGVLFASEKGIRLLDQSFGVQYAGAAVEAYNTQTYTDALVIPGTNQVLFLTNDGFSVMLDYEIKQWATWSIESDSAVPWGDGYAFLRPSDSLTLVRAEGVYLDGGSNYTYLMRTGPVRASTEGTLQGQARLRKFQVLGTYVSDHNLRVSLYYDREETPYEVLDWDVGSVIDSTTWGSGATWGSEAYWGGDRNANLYQFEHRPKRQKFAAVRFEVQALSSTSGAAFEITEIALEVGIKEGLQKHSLSRKY
jgi:hypothetical protein